jgi:hypothetical protein
VFSSPNDLTEEYKETCKKYEIKLKFSHKIVTNTTKPAAAAMLVKK